MKKRWLGAVSAAVAASTALSAPKTAVEVPVSEIGNTACLSSMSERPWWNKDWTRRAGLLVSSAVDVEDRNVMVDAVVDFGEEVNPDEVRLVTPWETLVDCVAERAQSATAVRLLFKTGLRVRENKPFLVYWGNPKAKKAQPMTSLQMREENGELRILNGKLDVSFDLNRRTEGLIRRLRILGSQAQTELLMRATDYAWCGFSVSMGPGGWTNVSVVADNAFKKAVCFGYPGGKITMSVYNEQPRVDWKYELARGRSSGAGICISWACGGDAGFDRIVYPGLAGKALSVVAALDSATDCIPHPASDFTPYVGEGWYAVWDRRVNDVVGMVFDRKALTKLSNWGNGLAAGVQVSHGFTHRLPRKDEPTPSGSGALVATMGRWQDVRTEYERLVAKPLVFAGKPEGVRDIPVTRPRLDHDWVYSIDANMYNATKPLEGTDWATNAACHLRSLGANVSRAAPAWWGGLRVPYDMYVRVTNTLALKSVKGGFGKWGENGNFQGKKLVERCEAVHAKGMSASVWGEFCPAAGGLDRADPTFARIDLELQNIYPKCGLDCVYNAAAQGEQPILTVPLALRKANNNEDWRNWKRMDDFFEAQDANTERVKEFYRESKKLNPGVPVVMWNSENTQSHREMFMGDQAGFFDTCMVEILPQYDIAHVKNAVKRMRALFDNEAGRTVHHHFYFYGTDRQDFSERISQVELPFVCGCNGFSLENIVYENPDRDATEIPGDFARFAEYTRLGEKAVRMAPVRNLAVLRDGAMYRYDMKHKLEGYKYGWRTRTDNRINDLCRLRNYSFDTVVNRYFTRKSLAKYRVVYVPEDPVLTDTLAGELVAFVKAGGGALLEGDTLGPGILKSIGLKDGVVTGLGKGKIVWFEKPPKLDEKFQKTVADLGGRNPYDIASRTLDSVLQASEKGMLLSVFNAGYAADTGKVSIRCPLSPAGASAFYVLDVKKGVRQAYTNGFEVSVAPRQCGFYLIGGDDFTALPATRPGVWDGAALEAKLPHAPVPSANVPTNFTQAVAVEYTRGTAQKPQTTRRTQECAIRAIPITADAYTAGKMGEALQGATYLHFVATDPSAADRVFADCPEELKALLKRGGGIIFDRMATGPKARAFLKDVGVFDPNEHAVAGGDRAVICSNLSTNSLLYPLKADWFNQGLEFGRSFPKWDRDRQFATYVGQHHPDRAMAVAQENVLGAGKVIFTQNDRAFNDWYENMRYGESILSWMIGRQVKEHAKLVKDLNGGEGRVEE